MVVEAGDGVATVETGSEMLMQRGKWLDAGLAVVHDACGLAVVVGDPVQDQVLLGREVPEEGRLGDLGGCGDVGDGDLVEAVGEEQGDRRVGDGVTRARLLAGAQSCRCRLRHACRITFVTRLLF